MCDIVVAGEYMRKGNKINYALQYSPWEICDLKGEWGEL